MTRSNRRHFITDTGARTVIQDGRGTPTQHLTSVDLARIARICTVCEGPVEHPDNLDASGRCTPCQP